MYILTSFVNDIFEREAIEASKLAKYNKKTTCLVHEVMVLRSHPHTRGAKNPENKWLNESAKPAPDCIAAQLIPRVGDVIGLKELHEYDALGQDMKWKTGRWETATTPPAVEHHNISPLSSKAQ